MSGRTSPDKTGKNGEVTGDPAGAWEFSESTRVPARASGPMNPGRARIVLGVDIGRSGALALLTGSGDLVFVADMPTLDDGPAGRPAVNAPLLATILRQWNPTDAFVEFVGARPGEAPSGAFAFGRSRGVIEGVLGTMGVPSKLLTPATWKRAVNIKPGREGAKDAARSEAIRRWPARADLFAAKGDDGRAEACLIAVAGMAREGIGR